MDKPLGYYVSLPASNEHHKKLQEIETRLGSLFQNLTMEQLAKLLAYCATVNAGDTTEEMSVYYLENQTLIFYGLPKSILFSFIPFIHSVIRGR